jgi:hypothetical protein
MEHTSGGGSSMLGYTVAPNPMSSPRTATLTIGGASFVVQQDAAGTTGGSGGGSGGGGDGGTGGGASQTGLGSAGPMTWGTGSQTVGTSPGCTVTVAPTKVILPSFSSGGVISVQAPEGCEWSVATTDTWVTVGAGGSGNGVAVIGVADTAFNRRGRVHVAGISVIVEQHVWAADAYGNGHGPYQPSPEPEPSPGGGPDGTGGSCGYLDCPRSADNESCTGPYVWIDDPDACFPEPQGQPLAISGAQDIWWFNGFSPSGYATSITLTSSAGAQTSWSIIEGSDKAILSASQGAQITLSSTQHISNTRNDISIHATDGTSSATVVITSRSPFKLKPGGRLTRCGPAFTPYVYQALVAYSIVDQIDNGTPLPQPVDINESWITDVIVDYHDDVPGEQPLSWKKSGFTEGAFRSPDSTFADKIEGDLPDSFPHPICDSSSIKDIMHWGQAWQVGTDLIGAGQRVQTDVIQKRLGTALHTVIQSPPH